MWVYFSKLSHCVYVFRSPLHYYGLALGLFVLSVQSFKMGIFNMHLQTVIMAFGLYSGFVVLDDWVVVNLGLVNLGSMDIGLGFSLKLGILVETLLN